MNQIITASGFFIRTEDNQVIRFTLYFDEAPMTVQAFAATLPFTRLFFHARLSGQEIWTDDAPELDIIQENASVYAESGECVIGPLKPHRTRTSKCMGIYYGNGKGVDCCNIFGKVLEEDLLLPKELGEKIWLKGAQRLTFDISD